MGRGYTPSSDLSSTKTRPCWCVFVFDAFPAPLDARRTRKHALVGVFSCSAHFRTPDVHRPRKHTLVGVFLCSMPFLCPLMHAEHENTRSRACFCVRRLACITPSIEPHPRWCVSVLGAFPALSIVQYTLSIKTCPRWRVLMLGAFSAPPMHTEHENTPTRACLCVRRLPFENARWGFPPRLDFSYVILSK